MNKLILLVIAVGVLYWVIPEQMAVVQEKTLAIVHDGAVRAMELTEPKSPVDKFLKEFQ
jgi:hypothetical protein